MTDGYQHAIAGHARVALAHQEVERRLQGSADDWIPATQIMHGVHEFKGVIASGLVRFHVTVTVGDPVIRAAGTGRRIRLGMTDSLARRYLVYIDGELTARRSPPRHTVLSYGGVWMAPDSAGMVRQLIGRTLALSLARATVRRIAHRLVRRSKGDAHAQPDDSA